MRRLAVCAIVLFACDKPAPSPAPESSTRTASTSPATPSASSVAIATASSPSASPSTPTSASASASASASPDGDYSVLTNEKFGFSCEYPSSLLLKPRDSDGRGQSFYSKDGKIDMRCWAMYSHQPAKELYEDWVRRPGLSFKELTGDEWTVAGAENNQLFWSRSVLADGLITTVEVHYDKSLKDTMEPMAKHSMASLKLLPMGARLKNK